MAVNNDIITYNYLVYLNNIYNFNNIITKLIDSFSYVNDNVKNSIFISNDINIILEEYPKYPDHYKLIENMDRLNLNSIKQLSPDLMEDIERDINSSILELKDKISKVPNTINKLLYDFNFQQTYINKSKNIYNTSQYFLNYFNFLEYDNYFYDFIGNETITDKTLDVDCIQHIIHFIFLVYLLPKTNNIRNQLVEFLLSKDDLHTDNIKSSFKNNIIIHTQQIQSEISKIILKNVYSIVEVSDTINNIANINLDTIINTLPTYFNSFIENTSFDQNSLYMTISNSLLHIQSLDILSNISDCIINKTTQFSTIEQFYLESCFSKLNENNLREYIMFSALYKYYPIKFINILPIILKQYVEDNILTDSEHVSLFDNHDMKQELGYYPNGYSINSTNFNNRDLVNFIKSYFNNNIDLNSYFNLITSSLNNLERLQELHINTNASKLFIILYLLDIIDSFIESDEFILFLEDCLKQVYDNLYTNGYIDHTFKWLQSIDKLKVYFKSFFRYNLVTDNFFNDIIINIQNDIDMILLQNTKSYSDSPDNLLNGKNTVFNTRYQFDENSVSVYIDNDKIDNNDYSVFGYNHTIIFNYPPIGNKITILYDIKYNIEINFTESKLNSNITNFIKSDNICNKMYYYVKNVYLSSVTKQIYFLILSNFTF